jgi:hypothetical protein
MLLIISVLPRSRGHEPMGVITSCCQCPKEDLDLKISTCKSNTKNLGPLIRDFMTLSPQGYTQDKLDSRFDLWPRLNILYMYVQKGCIAYQG